MTGTKSAKLLFRQANLNGPLYAREGNRRIFQFSRRCASGLSQGYGPPGTGPRRSLSRGAKFPQLMQTDEIAGVMRLIEVKTAAV